MRVLSKLGSIGLIVLLAGCLSPAPAPVTPPDSQRGPDFATDVDRPIDALLAAKGRWLTPFPVEEPAIHATVLQDGRIVFWGGLHRHGPDFSPLLASPIPAATQVLDLSGAVPIATTAEASDAEKKSDLFCAGQTLLPDGRVLAVGGTEWRTLPDAFFHGTKDVRLYDPKTNTWSSAPDMAFKRWYPSALTLPDGRVLIASGIENTNAPTMIKELEVFDPATTLTTQLPASADRDLPMYPRLYVVPSGPLQGDVFFQPGGCLWCPSGESDGEAAWNFAQSFDVESNTWTQHSLSVLGARQAPITALLALRPPEYSAKILTASGTIQRGFAATPTSEITDLSVVPPTHTLSGDMNEGRWFSNHVLLPDGTVLAVGGAKYDGVLLTGGDANDVAPVLNAELFDPDAPASGPGRARGDWRTLAPMTVARVYHSTALLLPDGRVWVAGSVPATVATPAGETPSEDRNEIFEPPYLFRGDRPAISDAPAAATWGEGFTVKTPDVERIEQVVLVRSGSVTHVYNPEQRLIELVVESRGDGTLSVRAPPNADLAPPGTYMLFLLAKNDAGLVPSVATVLQID